MAQRLDSRPCHDDGVHAPLVRLGLLLELPELGDGVHELRECSPWVLARLFPSEVVALLRLHNPVRQPAPLSLTTIALRVGNRRHRFPEGVGDQLGMARAEFRFGAEQGLGRVEELDTPPAGRTELADDVTQQLGLRTIDLREPMLSRGCDAHAPTGQPPNRRGAGHTSRRRDSTISGSGGIVIWGK